MLLSIKSINSHGCKNPCDNLVKNVSVCFTVTTTHIHPKASGNFERSHKSPHPFLTFYEITYLLNLHALTVIWILQTFFVYQQLNKFDCNFLLFRLNTEMRTKHQTK